jgi:hypothetical protein
MAAALTSKRSPSLYERALAAEQAKGLTVDRRILVLRCGRRHPAVQR